MRTTLAACFTICFHDSEAHAFAQKITYDIISNVGVELLSMFDDPKTISNHFVLQ